MPALLTRMSTSVGRSAMASRSARSARTGSTAPSPSRPASSLRPVSSRSTATTTAPAATNRSAMAAPIPLAAPVTRARRPDRSTGATEAGGDGGMTGRLGSGFGAAHVVATHTSAVPVCVDATSRRCAVPSAARTSAEISAGRSIPGRWPAQSSSTRVAPGTPAATSRAAVWSQSTSSAPRTTVVGTVIVARLDLVVHEGGRVGPLVGRDLDVEGPALHLGEQPPGVVVGVGSEPGVDVERDRAVDVPGLDESSPPPRRRRRTPPWERPRAGPGRAGPSSVTRSGWAVATSRATRPPNDAPTKAAAAMPWSSRKPTTSATFESGPGASGASPYPGRSGASTRYRSARAGICAAHIRRSATPAWRRTTGEPVPAASNGRGTRSR